MVAMVEDDAGHGFFIPHGPPLWFLFLSRSLDFQFKETSALVWGAWVVVVFLLCPVAAALIGRLALRRSGSQESFPALWALWLAIVPVLNFAFFFGWWISLGGGQKLVFFEYLFSPFYWEMMSTVVFVVFPFAAILAANRARRKIKRSAQKLSGDRQAKIALVSAYASVSVFLFIFLLAGSNLFSKWVREGFCSAIEKSDGKSVRDLLRFHPELVNSAISKESLTPLQLAAMKGDKGIAEVLLVYGKAEVNGGNQDGSTPLHAAADHGQAAMVEWLRAHDADLNVRNKDGETPLHFAVLASTNRLQTVRMFLAEGADVNSRNNKGQTPLFYAAAQSRRVVMELLIDYGAKAKVRDEKGLTLLHVAACSNHRGIVEALLAHKADINAQDKEGDTPLHLADRADVTELLLAHHADITIKNAWGQTALDLARWRGSHFGGSEIIGLLRKKGVQESVLPAASTEKAVEPQTAPDTVPPSSSASVETSNAQPADTNSWRKTR